MRTDSLNNEILFIDIRPLLLGGPSGGSMASGKYKDILVEKRGGVGWVTFNRPDRFNACDFAMFQEIVWGIREVSEDPKIGVIVLTGTGDKSFCTGGYLADLATFTS